MENHHEKNILIWANTWYNSNSSSLRANIWLTVSSSGTSLSSWNKKRGIIYAYLSNTKIIQKENKKRYKKRKHNYNCNHSYPDPGKREKINLNFYFHTFLWCLKRFYEGLKGLHKTFWGSAKKYKFKLTFTLMQLSEMHGAGIIKSLHNAVPYSTRQYLQQKPRDK